MINVMGLPAKYVQGQGVLVHLSDYVVPMGKKGAFAMVSPFIIDAYSDAIVSGFKEKAFSIALEPFEGECCKKEIDRMVDLAKDDYDVIIGIGGGKTLDTAKAVAYYSNLPLVICPSIASTDAPCSALSVLYTEDGSFERYLRLPQNPNLVLVDSKIIASAPPRFLAAGMGDALATYFEARACIKANATTLLGGTATQAAIAMAERCYDIILADGYKAKIAVENKKVTKAVENVIEANILLSGIGFESCGEAAAHAIHNGLTALPEARSSLHGEKVAFGIIAQLVLENASDEELDEVIGFCKSVGLPTNLVGLGISEVNDEKVRIIAKRVIDEDETINNMPFPVSEEDLCAAIFVADRLGSEY